MNLNTLAAQEADYKSGSLPVALYPNAMRREADGKQTFFARPIIREHLSMDDIASDMVVEGVNGGMSREQIVSTWKNINCAVLDRVANSYSVDTGLCLCSTKISGTFATDSEGFSRERHGIDMAFRTNRYVRDLESGGCEKLTPGGFLEITGRNLALFGDAPSVGLYFESEDDLGETVVLKTEKMGVNSSSRLACVVPATLAPGRYRLKVVTQFMHGRTQRKEPQSFTYDRTFNVIPAGA